MIEPFSTLLHINKEELMMVGWPLVEQFLIDTRFHSCLLGVGLEQLVLLDFI